MSIRFIPAVLLPSGDKVVSTQAAKMPVGGEVFRMFSKYTEMKSYTQTHTFISMALKKTICMFILILMFLDFIFFFSCKPERGNHPNSTQRLH